ncbi:MAG: chemotaxis protein CheX [Desulfobulbaceae bacterium]|nr:chemotaxis protein CheX [Desulfobulbaceae bacterium]
MDDNVKQAVSLSLAEVFETMFFTLLEPVDGIPARDEWSSEKDFVEAEISYTGANNSGELRFFFPQSLARSIATNFLGEPEDNLSDEQLVDTVRETVNMGVGSMLGRIDPDGQCALGIPQARLVSDFTPEKIIADLGLYVFRTSFGFLWMEYNAKSV